MQENQGSGGKRRNEAELAEHYRQKAREAEDRMLLRIKKRLEKERSELQTLATGGSGSKWATFAAQAAASLGQAINEIKVDQ